jgi:hypothetical protein
MNECNALSLHVVLAIGYLAPFDIIQSVYQINPVAAFELDKDEANTLRIACLYGVIIY